VWVVGVLCCYEGRRAWEGVEWHRHICWWVCWWGGTRCEACGVRQPHERLCTVEFVATAYDG
jgi:hypothetical protein